VSWIPRIGAEFAGYRLDALLGHGGMSIVYRAEHIALGRKVALKLLSPQLSEDESFRERFTRESRLAASLDHPNIIPIYEASESEGVFFIAMRYVEGADLRSLLKEGPIDPRRLIPIIDQTANALSAAHARGLVHRDVKPANILIDRGAGRDDSDHVYLSDFGVAKQVSAPGLTSTGTFVGTVDYASPEQIEGKELDGRADVYSLGCVVYECLTGSSAYDKDSEVALMYAHLLEPPPVVTEKRPDLPSEIDEVVTTALAKSRDERYETPKQFAAALSRVLGAIDAPVSAPGADAPATVLAAGLAATPTAGGPVSDAPDPAAAAALPPTSLPTVEVPGATNRGPRQRRTSIVVGAFIAGLIVVGGVVALAVTTMGGDDDKAAVAATTADTTATGPSATVAGGNPEASLLSVLVPSEIAATCATRQVATQGAVETNVCTAPDSAPISVPDTFELSFYKDSKALTEARTAAEASLKPARCGSGSKDVWIHAATGKTGGQRSCFIDGKGQFVVVWTHEKLGSEDHADMLGIAREPGRAPTIVRWWSSVNDVLGKCRAQIPAPTCFATIEAITGKS
jgi:serine/threonine-protein kinase